MIVKAFSVYDEKAAAFMPPFFMTTAGQAVRAFSDAVTGKDSDLARHPEDYSLYVVGEFNQGTGALEALIPSCIITGIAAKEGDILNALASR